MTTFGTEGDQEELGSYLYYLLMAHGHFLVNDVQIISLPETEKVGAQEFLAFFAGATNDGIPISGIFAVIKKEDRIFGVFSWMDDLDMHINQVETILSSIVLD